MHDIRQSVPELFVYPGSLLYVGARLDACTWLSELALAGNRITLLEIERANAQAFVGDSRVRGGVYTGDVRHVSGDYDYAFWWQGPQVIDRREVVTTVRNLERHTGQIVVLASPWGYLPGGDNKWHIYPEHYEELGYEFAVIGEPDEIGSEIVAWKRLNV